MTAIDPAYRTPDPDPSAEPLVLIHGLTGSWRVWRPLIPALEEAGYEVFAPTLPGHAGAAALPDGFTVTLPAVADLVEAQLDEAGIRRAHLVGNSLGGWLSLELGRRGRALSVTALSPPGAWGTAKDLARVVRLFRAASFSFARFGESMLPLLRRPRFRKLALSSVAEHGDRVSAADAVGLMQDAIDCVLVDGLLTWVRTQESFAEADGPQDYPLTIAWSEFDRTIPFEGYGVPMLAANPGAEHITLPGVGHVPMLDDPDLVVRTIVEHARVPAPSAA